MSSIEGWLRMLCEPSDVGEGDYFRIWGWTIYRTAYGPSTGQRWDEMLRTIQTHAYKELLEMTDTTERDAGFQHIWSLFRLDARSDPALDGLDMDQLRLRFNEGHGGQPVNTGRRSHQAFLVADEGILSDVDDSTIKCVDARYRAEEHIPRNTRMGGQRYFGWMPMRAVRVVDLWERLNVFDLERIAPLTIGGSHLIVWNGD